MADTSAKSLITGKFVLRLHLFVIVVMSLAISAATAAPRNELAGSVGTDNGKLELSFNSAPLIEAEVVFWHGEWGWIGPGLTAKPSGSGSYAVKGQDEASKFSLEGRVEMAPGQEGNSTLRFAGQLEEGAEGLQDAYGGISFRIDLGLLRRLSPSAVPKILPDKTGWSIELGPGQIISVVFDRPVDRLEFEPGREDEIRAYLLSKNAQRDRVAFDVTLTFPGVISKSAGELLAAKSPDWPISDVHWNRSPIDLSFLNADDRPAGKRGFLRASGPDLVFDDGHKPRFWGTNIAAYSLFDVIGPLTIKAQAQRLAKLGFNLVRIHHHDSTWVQPNVFGRESGQTRKLGDFQMERIHWWVKCLRDEGIYVWLDLHVGREVTAADNVDAFKEIEKDGRGTFFGYVFVNPSLQERMKEFATDYLSRTNPHTGLALKDDPAVVGILITNENDLTSHFGNRLVPGNGVPWHSKRYVEASQDFARKNGLPADMFLRSWEHGTVRLFLGDLEHRFFEDMKAHLRGLGVKVPIVGTNTWGGSPMSSLPSLAADDLVDVHIYGKPDEVRFNPGYRAGFASWIGAGAVAGLPVSVSEWNVEPFPTFDRFFAPLQIAALAGFQGWGPLMQYNYSQASLLGEPRPERYSAYNDPSLLAALTAAAVMHRQGHVAEGKETTYLNLPREVMIDQATDPNSSRALRTLVETTKFRVGLPALKELPWHAETKIRPGAKVVSDPQFSAIDLDASSACSDTGEICRDWERGVFTVDTAASQIAGGWIGGRHVKLRDVEFKIDQASAAVSVQSLGEQPIPTADELLISLTAQVLPVSPARGSFRSEPVTGEIRIRAKPGLKLYRLDANGARRELPLKFEDGVYSVRLDAAAHSHWYTLR